MKFLRASVPTLLCCLDFLHFSALSNILQVFAMRPAAARQQTDYFRFISKSRTHTHLNIQSTGTPDTQPRFFENIFFVWGNVGWLIFVSLNFFHLIEFLDFFFKILLFIYLYLLGDPCVSANKILFFLVVEISAGRLVQQKSGGNSTRNAAWIK